MNCLFVDVDNVFFMSTRGAFWLFTYAYDGKNEAFNGFVGFGCND